MDEGERPRPAPRVIGKVIKSDGADVVPIAEKQPPPRPRVLTAETYDAHAEAKKIREDAMRDAERIRAEAHHIRDEAVAKARDEAKADVQAKWADELARAKIEAGRIIESAQQDVVELSLRIASKIIGREIEREPDTLLQIFAQAAEASRAAKALVFRVNPEDGKQLREKKPRLMELIGRTVDIAVKDDPEVEKGGCIIQTDYGVIDGQLRTQIDMLRTLLTPDIAKKEVK